MPTEIKNIFISHVHEDDDGLQKTKDLLGKHGMEVRDGSINSDKPNNATSPDYIKSGIIKPRIEWASTLLVYVTPETKNSDWVNWEIECAAKMDKNIVGVWANGEKDCEIPEALKDYGDAMVAWNGEKIIDAINGNCHDWEYPTGDPIPARDIPKHGC